MQPKKIYLIRHGESTANVNPTDDRIDPPLTALGRNQSRQVTLDVDTVICSPLRRTLETLYYSNIQGKNYIIYNDIREKRCGLSDHMLFEDIHIETTTEFNTRIESVANYLIQLPYDNVAVVCHGCVIAALTGTRLKNAQVIEANLDYLTQIASGAKYNITCCSYTGW